MILLDLCRHAYLTKNSRRLEIRQQVAGRKHRRRGRSTWRRGAIIQCCKAWIPGRPVMEEIMSINCNSPLSRRTYSLKDQRYCSWSMRHPRNAWSHWIKSQERAIMRPTTKRQLSWLLRRAQRSAWNSNCWTVHLNSSEAWTTSPPRRPWWATLSSMVSSNATSWAAKTSSETMYRWKTRRKNSPKWEAQPSAKVASDLARARDKCHQVDLWWWKESKVEFHHRDRKDSRSVPLLILGPSARTCTRLRSFIKRQFNHQSKAALKPRKVTWKIGLLATINSAKSHLSFRS